MSKILDGNVTISLGNFGDAAERAERVRIANSLLSPRRPRFRSDDSDDEPLLRRKRVPAPPLPLELMKNRTGPHDRLATPSENSARLRDLLRDAPRTEDNPYGITPKGRYLRDVLLRSHLALPPSASRVLVNEPAIGPSPKRITHSCFTVMSARPIPGKDEHGLYDDHWFDDASPVAPNGTILTEDSQALRGCGFIRIYRNSPLSRVITSIREP